MRQAPPSTGHGTPSKRARVSSRRRSCSSRPSITRAGNEVHATIWRSRGRLAGALGGVLYAVVFVWVDFSPKTLAVGYAHEQPIPYSHALHARPEPQMRFV